MWPTSWSRRFVDKHPKGTSPIYRVRSPDKSHTPVRWRVSMTAENLALRRTERDTLAIRQLLAKAAPAMRRDWLAFEARRLPLNYQLSVTFYEIERLRRYLALHQAWSTLKKR